MARQDGDCIGNRERFREPTVNRRLVAGRNKGSFGYWPAVSRASGNSVSETAPSLQLEILEAAHLASIVVRTEERQHDPVVLGAAGQLRTFGMPRAGRADHPSGKNEPRAVVSCRAVAFFREWFRTTWETGHVLLPKLAPSAPPRCVGVHARPFPRS